jgi:hypothetical protein
MPRRLLNYVLLEENQDRPAAETALRDLLALALAEARHNLEALHGGTFQLETLCTGTAS